MPLARADDAGMGKIKGSGGNLHFQTVIATHEIERWRAGRATEKGCAERLLDGLHGRRFGAGRQGVRRVHPRLFLFGERRGRSLIPLEGLALGGGLARQLLKGLIGGLCGNWPGLAGGIDDGSRGYGAVAEQLAEQQDEQAGSHRPGKDAAAARHSRGCVMALEIREYQGDFDVGPGSSGMDIRDAPSSIAAAAQVQQAQKERET